MIRIVEDVRRATTRIGSPTERLLGSNTDSADRNHRSNRKTPNHVKPSEHWRALYTRIPVVILPLPLGEGRGEGVVRAAKTLTLNPSPRGEGNPFEATTTSCSIAALDNLSRASRSLRTRMSALRKRHVH